jgi:hypothetical protein
MATFQDTANRICDAHEAGEDIGGLLYDIVVGLYDRHGYTSADDVRMLLSLAAMRDVPEIVEVLAEQGPSDAEF